MKIYIVFVFIIFDTVASDHCPIGRGWVYLNGNCFLYSTQQLTWKEAVKDCRYYGATLLQFYDSDIKAQFVNFTKANKFNVERWWTGLNDIGHVGTWVWGPKGSEYAADRSVLEWTSEPDDTSHSQNCGGMNIMGELSDEKCSERHGYICEHKNTDGCEFEWLVTQTSCYYFSDQDDPYNVIPWSDANQRCQQLVANATLLKFESLAEQLYMRYQLPTMKLTTKLYWIGMTDQTNEGHWVWTDGTPVTDQGINWAVEPNNIAGREYCGMLYSNGRFADKDCNLTSNYVCNTPATVDTGDYMIVNKLGCPYGWTRAGHKCYLFQYERTLNWSDTLSACNQVKARPLQITTMDEKNFIQLETAHLALLGSFWTGLTYHTSSNLWYWSTGNPANTSLIRWNSEPNDYAGNEDCAIILQDSTFNDMSCHTKQGYICELQSEDSPCASGWLSRSDEGMYSCYYVSNTTDDDIANWDEARDKCKQIGQPMNAYLFAVNDQDELEFIYHALLRKTKTGTGWWTGLNDRKMEGNWEYDTSFNTYKPELIPWDSEPNNSGGKDYCACIYSGGRYNDIDCSTKMAYICEADATGQSSAGNPTMGRFWIVTFLCVICLSTF